MSRELRRVKSDWKHPKAMNGHYIPLLKESYEEAVAVRAAYRPEDHDGCPVDEWFSSLYTPRMPNWPEEEKTHYQMYETTSEGTPISPVLSSPEEVARWCADHGASAFGDMTATYEQWLATCHLGLAPSAMVVRGKGLVSGVEGMATSDEEEP